MNRVVICSVLISLFSLQTNGKEYKKVGSSPDKVEPQVKGFAAACQPGKTITEIAERLNLSVKTVSTHKARILQKMNMTNPAELIRYAINNRLVDDPDVTN